MTTVYATREAGGWTLEFAYDATVVATIKATVPASRRSWDSVERQWWVAGPYLDVVRRALGARCTWIVVGGSTPPTVGLEDAFVVLLDALPPTMRTTVKRALLRAVHPDVGGDHMVSAALNRAVERVAA